MKPLDGVRVLDLSRLLPGPFCTLVLSELGADVVKVEDTGGGDYLRLIPPLDHGMGGAFYALNRGKRSVSINLKQDQGRDLLLRMLPEYQVVVESFRPGVLDRLGLGYDQLCAANPEVVLCSITGYGQDGPLRDRAGHDIDYLALSGVLAAGGQDGGDPALPGVQMADVAGGAMWAAIRILAALHSGKGAHLDVSMTEGVMSLLLPWLGDFAFSGKPLRRGQWTLNGGAARYNTYPTSDGRHLAVGSLEPKFWISLCAALGIPGDMDEDPERQRQMKEKLGQRLGEQTLEQWSQKLPAADACVEPVLEMDELAHHPQHQHRGMFYDLEDPERGPVSLLRLPVEGDPSLIPAPAQGQHTDEVLGDLGCSAEELAGLRADRVIR